MEKWLRVISFACLSYGANLSADNEHTFGMFETSSERAVKLAQYKKAKEEAGLEEEKQRVLLLAHKEQQRKEEEQRQRELYARKLKEKELAIEQKRLEVQELQLARERETEQIKYQRELLHAARDKERFTLPQQNSLSPQLKQMREASGSTDTFGQAMACAEKQLEVTLHALNNQQRMIDTLHNELMQLSALAYND